MDKIIIVKDGIVYDVDMAKIRMEIGNYFGRSKSVHVYDDKTGAYFPLLSNEEFYK